MADDPKPDPAPVAVVEPATPDTKPPADPDGGDDFDKERALNTIRAQREAEKELRASNKALKEKADKFDASEAEKLSDQEKAAKRADEAERKAANADSKLQRANLIAALSEPTFGIVNARAAAKLIEGVEYDGDGEPTNLGKPDEDGSLLATFLSENQFLQGTAAKPKPPSLDGGDDTERGKPNLTAAEIAAAERYDMTQEEYAAFKNGGSLADLKQAGLKDT